MAPKIPLWTAQSDVEAQPRHGRVLEGLEVRWGLVANILGALCRYGLYRGEGSFAPMHKYYDRRLFDVVDEAELRETHAPEGRDCKIAKDFVQAGLDVAYAGEPVEEADLGGVSAVVSEKAFI